MVSRLKVDYTSATQFNRFMLLRKLMSGYCYRYLILRRWLETIEAVCKHCARRWDYRVSTLSATHL